MRKEASLEQWKELYEVTLNLKALEPWNYFGSEDLVAIALQGEEEPVFMSIMGMMGSCYGISMYEGMEGFCDFDMVARAGGEDGLPVPYAMMEQSCITWYVGDREEVPEDQRKVIKKLELGFRGKGQWQYFYSFAKGYMPFTPDAREVSVLTEAFKGLFMATRAVKEKRISVDFEHGEILWRVYNAETEEWKMFAGPLPPYERNYPEIELEDQDLKLELKAQPRNSQELALDIAYMKTGIRDEEYDRPVCPRLLVVLDWKADMILRMDMMKPDDDEIGMVLDFFVTYVMTAGLVKKVRARNPWVFAALSEICDYCGIELKKDRLGKVDRILEEMAGMMG